MDAHTHICPSCGKRQTIPFGLPLVCQFCGSAFTRDAIFPAELEYREPSKPTGCRTCLFIILGILVVFAAIIYFGPHNGPEYFEQIEQENLQRKVHDDLQHEDAERARAMREAVERIHQRQGY